MSLVYATGGATAALTVIGLCAFSRLVLLTILANGMNRSALHWQWRGIQRMIPRVVQLYTC